MIKQRKHGEEQVAKQVEAYEGWTSWLPKDAVKEWEKLVLAWEHAPYPKKDSKGLLNLFAIPNECTLRFH